MKIDSSLIFISFILAVIAVVIVLLGKYKTEYVYWLVTVSAVLIVLSRVIHKKFLEHIKRD